MCKCFHFVPLLRMPRTRKKRQFGGNSDRDMFFVFSRSLCAIDRWFVLRILEILAIKLLVSFLVRCYDLVNQSDLYKKRAEHTEKVIFVKRGLNFISVE